MRLPALLFIALGACTAVSANELVVKVTGIRSAEGQIGCALFSSERGFPSQADGAQTIWLPADPAGVQCVFDRVPPGTYAASVIHDLNGNRKTDTNLLGAPTEDWGVSNNVRPFMRAPRFDEAAVRIPDAKTNAITIQLAR